ncbi:MAG: O-antigen ligase family protein [Bacteroidota bacterium]
MIKLLQLLNHQFIGVLSLLLLVVGMVVSPAMMSIGVIGLAINWVINVDVRENVRRLLHSPVFWSLTALFFLWLLSGLWSENTEYWAHRMRNRLPFLLMPAGVLALPRFDRGVYYSILYLFFLLLTCICFFLFCWYLSDFEQITLSYRKGHVLPTPVMHIRFSLMVAYAVAIGISFIQERWYTYSAHERTFQYVATGFLVVFLHILAVRSGLVALYGVLGYFLIRDVIVGKKWGRAILITAFLSAGLWGAYQTIPSLKNKIDYTFYNLYHIRHKNDMADLSDTHRIGTVKAGLDMGKNSPLLGAGIGDLQDETERYLQEYYPGIAGSGFTPQSQFVWQYAATGLIGLVIFAAVVFLPLFYQGGWKEPLLGSFLAIAIPSFIIEQTLETQLGTAIYLTFLLMAARYYFTADHPDRKVWLPRPLRQLVNSLGDSRNHQ